MATAHSLTVITNSCVKPPINPETGLSTTLDERTNASSQNIGRQSPDSDQENRQSASTMAAANGLYFNKTDSVLQDMTGADLSNLTDEEFYKKLRDLREEHKKTLQICEKIYNDKLGGNLWNQTSGSRQLNKSSHIQHNSSFGAGYDGFNTSKHNDNVLDMSGSMRKPPSGRPRPQHSPGFPQTSKTYNENEFKEHVRKSDEDYWRPLSNSASEFSDEESARDRSSLRNSHNTLNDSAISALDKIETMWNNFDINEFAPRTRPRPRSASLSRMSNASTAKSLSASQEWRHRITIPEPFTMTLRDESTDRPKSRTMEEFERQKMQEELEREKELQKQFKATPVPAHVYMPLFDEIMETRERKRQMVKEKSQDLLKSIQKPFKFTLREEEQRQRNREERENYLHNEFSRKVNTFKAKPVPDYLYDENINERLAEEEEYRKIKIQMRAEDMLRNASLPPNMQSRGPDYVKGRTRQRSKTTYPNKQTVINDNPPFKPRINDTVPDFEEIHRQFSLQLAERKYAKEATVCKPFKLRTSQNSVQKKHKIYEDIRRDRDTLSNNHWDFKGTGSSNLRSMSFVSSSMDSIPTKMTQTAELRKSALKNKIQQKMEEELKAIDTEKKRQRKEKELQRIVAERAAVNDLKTTMKTQARDKMREFKTSERARQEEYRRQLREMDDRLGKRPLLFERTTQESAKQKAEKRFMDTLARAGIDEAFIERKGQSAANSVDDYMDSDDEPLYSKQSSARSGSYSRQSSARSKASYSKSRSHSYNSATEKKYSDSEDDKTAEDVSDLED